MQIHKFKNVGEFLDFLPEDERTIVDSLRPLIMEVVPDGKEKLAYNVPFYYRYGRICFIWPASVPWGGVDRGVAIGFCRGDLLNDDMCYLERGNRREVYTKTFGCVDEIDPGLLRSYLFEAREVDEQLSRTNRGRNKE